MSSAPSTTTTSQLQPVSSAGKRVVGRLARLLRVGRANNASDDSTASKRQQQQQRSGAGGGGRHLGATLASALRALARHQRRRLRSASSVSLGASTATDASGSCASVGGGGASSNNNGKRHRAKSRRATASATTSSSCKCAASFTSTTNSSALECAACMQAAAAVAGSTQATAAAAAAGRPDECCALCAASDSPCPRGDVAGACGGRANPTNKCASSTAPTPTPAQTTSSKTQQPAGVGGVVTWQQSGGRRAASESAPTRQTLTSDKEQIDKDTRNRDNKDSNYCHHYTSNASRPQPTAAGPSQPVAGCGATATTMAIAAAQAPTQSAASLLPPTSSSQSSASTNNGSGNSNNTNKKTGASSLLSRARNSTFNLAALATSHNSSSSHKINCSASSNALWLPSMSTPTAPAPPPMPTNRSQQWRDTIAGELGGEVDANAARVLDYTVQSAFDSSMPQSTCDDRLPPMPPTASQQAAAPSSGAQSSNSGAKNAAQQPAADKYHLSARKSASTKEKSRRHKEAERVEKLRLLVSYLRSGSGQSLHSPVALEADEIELAERYKLHRILCEQCLQETELQQQQLFEKQQQLTLKTTSLNSPPSQEKQALSVTAPASSSPSPFGGSESSATNQAGTSTFAREGEPVTPLLATAATASLDPCFGVSGSGIVINIRRSSGQFQHDSEAHNLSSQSATSAGSGIICDDASEDIRDHTSSIDIGSALMPTSVASLVPNTTSTPNVLAQSHQLSSSASSQSFDQQLTQQMLQTKAVFDALSPPQQQQQNQAPLLCYRCQKPTGQTRSSMVSSANLTATASVASDLGNGGQNAHTSNVGLFQNSATGTASSSGKMPVCSTSTTNGSLGCDPNASTLKNQVNATSNNNHLHYNVLHRRTRNASSIPHIGNVSWVLRHSISDPGSSYERSPMAQHVTGCCCVAGCQCSSRYSSSTGQAHMQSQTLQNLSREKQIQNQQNQSTASSSQSQCNANAPTSLSMAPNGSTKLFYIEDIETRKDSDSSGAPRQSAATHMSSPLSCSASNHNNSNIINNQRGQQQQTKNSSTCICENKNYSARGSGLASYCNHERSKASISSSEAIRDLAMRSWSSEMFLSYTPSVAVMNNTACNGCHHSTFGSNGQNSNPNQCEYRRHDSDTQSVSTVSKSTDQNKNNQQTSGDPSLHDTLPGGSGPQSPSLSTLNFRGDGSPRDPYHDGDADINGLVNSSYAKSISHISQPPTPASNNVPAKSTSAWTNPQNLASWIDSEVNSLVSDLEAEIHQVKSEKINKSGGRRRWLVGVGGSNSNNSNSNNARDRRNSSGAHST